MASELTTEEAGLRDDGDPLAADPARPGRWKPRGLCVLAGVLLAASLPPWGFWPAAFVGIALVDRLLARQRAAVRFRRGSLVALALFAPTMAWLKDMTVPGYGIAVLLFAAIAGGFLALCPPGAGRRLALPAAWLLAEAFRGAWPFGGVPLSILAVGQVGGPLAGVARVGGTMLLGAVTVVVGVGLSALLDRSWRAAGGALLVAGLVVVGATAAPHGSPTGRQLSVAFVQGGGKQGTRAINTDPRKVFDRHMKASRAVPVGMDLTLWPEDVVDTKTYVVDAEEGDELAALARRKHTTLIVGVVEDEGDAQFHNASEVWNAQGTPIDRYEKVHRVPFGEWVPFRSLLEHFAGDSLPQRDAIVGKGPATLTTPHGKLAVVISWEVFFGSRARDGVLHGGEVVVNPTNGSSFTGTLVQTQQIASSRLRAIETGRWVVQIAPTGFSAFVTPGGHVLERTGVSQQAVRTHVVAARHGFTLYTRLGDGPFVLGALVLLLAAWVLDRRGRPTDPATAT